MEDASHAAKQALNIWCSKKKLKIEYSYLTVDSKFECQIKIESINRIVGSSIDSSKKGAANQAAWAAVKYLIDNKFINDYELNEPCYKALNISGDLFTNSQNSNFNQQRYNSKPNQQRYNNHSQSNYNNSNQNAYNSQYNNNNNHYPSIIAESNVHPVRAPVSNPGPHHTSWFDEPVNSPLQHQPEQSTKNGPGGPDNYPPPPNQYRPNFKNKNYGRDVANNQGRWSNDSSSSQNWDNRSPYPPHQHHMERNRKVPPQNEIIDAQGRMIGGDNNVNRMMNLNLNDGRYQQMNRDCFQRNPKKLRFDQNTVRYYLEDIQKECNFTLDNAKQQLNIFFQTHKIKPTSEFSSFGPQHAKKFVAKLKFYLNKNKKLYSAEESGQSKQEASRLVALNILHQLFKENMIESFDSDELSKRQLMKMSMIYQLNVENKLKEYLINACNYTISYGQYAQQLQMMNPMFGVVPQFKPQTDSNFLYWCPPLENFNPWTNSNLDNTEYAGKTKSEINQQLQVEFQSLIKSQKFQSILAARMRLPIWHHKEKVIELIENQPVVIIKGSTGCGKTTQVSQFILDSYIRAGNGANCNIIVTQPRRISAISISERVAHERCEQVIDGKCSVGYAVRFDHVYPRPYGSILFCTTGHLLRRIQGGLKGVSHLIIDEVHERDVNTDLLLIIVRDLIKLNLNIHVIIMSATLGISHFQRYFKCNNILELESNLFPVQRYYLEDTIEMIKWDPKRMTYLEDDVEINDDTESVFHFDYPKSISSQTIELLKQLKEGVICYELIVSILEYIHTLTITGSVLIFLPGWSAIFGLLNHLQRHRIFGNDQMFLLLPLHSQLSHKDNNRIFLHTPQRKIILSTNIAETSITIDDVVFVIDTCLIKRKLYSSRTNITSYIIDWVSKSNIQQRQGRAGRVQSGYFFVLCTRKRFELLEEFKKPDILTCSLVETILLIKYLGFGSVQEFLARALDPPPSDAVRDAINLLKEINAFDSDSELTAVGNILAKLPIDPRIGKMVIESIPLNVASSVATIAAASSLNFEIFDNTDMNLLMQTLIQLDEERYSDHLTVLKAFNMCDSSRRMSSQIQCVNWNAISVVENVRRQLVRILIKCGFKEDLFYQKSSISYTTKEFDIISGLLITAFYPNVCTHKDNRRILTDEERIGLIHKTSVFYAYAQNQKLSKCTRLKSPVLIYSEKSQTKNLISSKQMTMISFLQLLLFGVKNFQLVSSNMLNNNNPTAGTSSEKQATNKDECNIILDGWIEIKIDAEVFNYIWQIKTEFEQLIVKICTDPNYSLTELDTTIIYAVEQLCLFDNIQVDIIGKQP